MAVAEVARRGGFSLRLEQGLGRLIVADRRVGDWLVIDTLQLALEQMPSRLDMTSGVERFRHQRARLDILEAHIDDAALTRALAAPLAAVGITSVEVRAVDDELLVVGELSRDGVSPFVARARLEPASIARERAVLLSVYQVQLLGPTLWTGVQLAQALLTAAGLAERLAGPTAAVIDPVDDVLQEICAELGWKVPARETCRLLTVAAEAGRVRFVAERTGLGIQGPARLPQPVESGARLRRFLADYEAKSLYASIEGLIGEGRLDRAATAYARQLEVHPKHPFIIERLLGLWAVSDHHQDDAAALARACLASDPEHVPALRTLAIVFERQGDLEAAAERYRRLAEVAELRGEGAERAQALRALATVLAPIDAVRAIEALEGALTGRRHLPGALRALADLHAQSGHWAAALKVRERLLAGESDRAAQVSLLGELGRLALDNAQLPEAAQGYFERALDLEPADKAALRGLADALVALDALVPATRALDRAVRLAQAQGDVTEAALLMVRLGSVWLAIEGGASTAALRFRQALLLDPKAAGALLGLARCAAAAGDVQRAIGRLQEALAVEQDPVSRGQLQLEMGRLLLGAGRQEQAALHFQHALEADETLALEALDALVELFTADQRWGDVVRSLEMRVSRTADVAAAARVQVQLAQVLAHRLGDGARARKLLEQAAAADANNVAALQTLVSLERAAKDHRALEKVLAAWVQRLDDPSQRAAAHTERGDLLRLHLNRSDEAVEAYTLALGCQPANHSALVGLTDLYRERERYAELADLLGRLATVSARDFDAGLAWLERGRIEMDLLDRHGQAVESLKAAVEKMPDDTEALRRLGDLYFARDAFVEALGQYQILLEIYEAEGYDEDEATFKSRVAATHSALGDDEAATALCKQAVASDPDRLESLEQLQDLLLRAGDLAGIVDAFEEALEVVQDVSVRGFLALRAGRLAWRELRDPARATGLLEQATSWQSTAAEAARLLAEIPGRKPKLTDPPEGPGVEAVGTAPAPQAPAGHVPAAHVAETSEPVIHTTPKDAAGWLAAAEAQRDEAQDPDGALALFAKALDAAVPGDDTWTEAMEAMEDVHSLRQDWSAMVSLADRRLSDGVGDAAEVALQKASLFRTMGQPQAAIDCVQQAAGLGERAEALHIELLVETGQQQAAVDLLLADLAAQSREDAAFRRWRAADLLGHEAPAALQLLEDAAEALQDDEAALAFLAAARAQSAGAALIRALDLAARTHPGNGERGSHRSRLRQEAAGLALQTGDLEGARQLIEAALSDWPENVEALDTLVTVLERLDDVPALILALEQQVSAALPGAWRGGVTLRIAELYADRVGDKDRALGAATEALRDLKGTAQDVRALQLLERLAD